MAIEHSVIPNADLHEPKDANTAVNNTVYVSDGLGSGSWKLPSIEGQTTATINTFPHSDGVGGVDWKLSEGFNQIMAATDFTTQTPVGLDIPLQILFGPAQISTNFSISGAGDLTCNIAGRYMFIADIYVYRSTAAGVANLFLRALLNSAQEGHPVGLSMDDNGNSVPLQRTIIGDLVQGDILAFEFLRDSSGNNNGELLSITPVTTWGPTPSARLRIFKL